MGVSFKEILIGRSIESVADIAAVWEELYVRTAMNGRRGVVINAIGAIDIALYDALGKSLGVPVHELIGGAKVAQITPYASLLPQTGSLQEYERSLVEWARRAVDIGFRAVKSELILRGPYAHQGLTAPDEQATAIVGAIRDAIGPDTSLMIDVAYAWPDPDTAIATLRSWEQFNLQFIETPLWVDDLDGLRRVATEQPIPVASGEWLTTRFEFFELVDRGDVAVVQPDVGRVGGITEALRVCEFAVRRGRTVVPHLWKTGISIAAAAHLAAARPEVAMIEFLPKDLSESELRADLTSEELVFTGDGLIAVPQAPGLGIELDRSTLERCRAEGYADLARKAT